MCDISGPHIHNCGVTYQISEEVIKSNSHSKCDEL